MRVQIAELPRSENPVRKRLAGAAWPDQTRPLLIFGLLAAALCSGCVRPAPIDFDAAIHLTTDQAYRHASRINVNHAADDGAIIITTDGVTLDLADAALLGPGRSETPDRYHGRGVVVRGARDVTIRNGRLSHFKVAIYAEDAPGLRIENCDVSANYRQRLKSTPQREHLDDWLYGHENDDNQWLRYGAGIYLYRCNGAIVRNCRARNGQNGICLVRCDDATVVGCDMSFMSGWGLAMWRSSRCRVIGNRFDYCVRGYSHGVYARGQDSAGILVYEQCSDNVFAYNRATHGGDGFFLYAGNETVYRTGEGGCNRNLVYMNDFSHAVANGIEATFSDENVFVLNKLYNCDHGIWAGYSTRSQIWQNDFQQCKNGISIEHGRNNQIKLNDFASCDRGIRLWWDDDKDLLDSPYAKQQGAESRGEVIVGNRFKQCRKDVDTVHSDDLSLGGNRWSDTKESEVTFADIPVFGQRGFFDNKADPFGPSGSVGIPVLKGGPPDRMGCQPLEPLPGVPEGKEYIFIDEWGPYDFQSPRVHPAEAVAWGEARFNLLGPPGMPVSLRSLTRDLLLSPSADKTPAALSVKCSSDAGAAVPFAIQVLIGGGKHLARGVVLNARWTVRFYKWTPELDPRRGDDNWARITADAEVHREPTTRLDFVWGGSGPAAGLSDHFAAVATTTMKLPAGRWRLRTISDDGVRLYVDGNRVIDNWTWHVPTEDTTELVLAPPADNADRPGSSAAAAEHEFRVEYFEIDGHAQLQFFLEPVDIDVSAAAPPEIEHRH